MRTKNVLRLMFKNFFLRFSELPNSASVCSTPPLLSHDGGSVIATESIYGQSQISFGASNSNPSSSGNGTGTSYPRRGQTRQPVTQVTTIWHDY